MNLDKQQIKTLKAKAHHLDPVVTIGQKGLTEAVLAEIDIALEHHELIKVKVPQGEKAEKQNLADNICEQTNAALIGIIGRIVIIYRKTSKQQ